MPSKDSIHQTATSLAKLLLDLVLSFTAYWALIYILSTLVETTARLFFPDTSPTTTLVDRRNEIMRSAVLLLWAARLVLRYRGHTTCFLRWLSPLFPEPYAVCLCCGTDVHGELRGGEGPLDEGFVGQRGIGIFL